MKFVATIFVEGDADLKFISDFVESRFSYSLRTGIEIRKTQGKDNLDRFSQNFRESTDLGLTNLVVFDANGSFSDRRDELNQKKTDHSIEFQLFLFPNNHDSGNLETLLRRIARNQNLFQCIDTYSDCISKLRLDELKRFD